MPHRTRALSTLSFLDSLLMQYRNTAPDDAGGLGTYNHTCQLQDPAISRKLTILIEDLVHEGLHRVVGGGSISKFIEILARMSRRRTLGLSIAKRHTMQRASARRTPGRRGLIGRAESLGS
jgi:hypothetical protein